MGGLLLLEQDPQLLDLPLIPQPLLPFLPLLLLHHLTEPLLTLGNLLNQLIFVLLKSLDLLLLVLEDLLDHRELVLFLLQL